MSYGKFQHDTPNGLACSSEKLMGVASTPSPLHWRGIYVYLYLTLAGTGHFASFHVTRGGGTTLPCVSPLIELELRRKKRACTVTKRLLYKLKVLGQPVPKVPKVRSSAKK